jgi:Protein of unknown function (DUF3168)
MALMVDVERLASSWLRARPEVAAIVADRVVTEIPHHAVFPMLRVWLIGGAPVWSRPLWLDQAVIQVDAFGGPKVQARQLMDVTRDAFADAFLGDHPGAGVVTSVNFGDLSYLPDDTWEPPKPRYAATVSIFIHPPR